MIKNHEKFKSIMIFLSSMGLWLELFVYSTAIISGAKAVPPPAHLQAGYAHTANFHPADTIALRLAFLGDMEPKPLGEFPHTEAAVDLINQLSATQYINFVIGIGDVAHKGTEVQYEAATTVLQMLDRPFYPIMGNEEHGSTVDRYLYYAQQWNSEVKETRYVLEYPSVAFLLVSPDYERDFTKEGAQWILDQMETLAPKPVVLVVHAAQQRVFPEIPKKGVKNRLFRKKVISQANLKAMVSGDLHMDMDRVQHSKKLNDVHYLHIPALERTKIPDESRHVPMIRIMSISTSGFVTVETYSVTDGKPLPTLFYSFSLN
jgi:3',5'-cyclic-AMP phosphodiesterase